MKTICANCNNTGFIKLKLYNGTIVDETCECPIGVELQSDLEKADQKFYAQMLDLTPEDER